MITVIVPIRSGVTSMQFAGSRGGQEARDRWGCLSVMVFPPFVDIGRCRSSRLQLVSMMRRW
jgi:hypothetical protein